MLDGGEQHAGQGFDGQLVRARDLDQLAELQRFLALELLGAFGEGLEFGVEISGFAGHGRPCSLPLDGGVMPAG